VRAGSFPTLLIFQYANMVKNYDGGRSQDEIEACVVLRACAGVVCKRGRDAAS
jgi:hypothetical protein